MRDLEWLWSAAQSGSRGKLERFCEYAWSIRYLPHRPCEPGLCSQSPVVLRSNAWYCSSQAHETRTRMIRTNIHPDSEQTAKETIDQSELSTWCNSKQRRRQKTNSKRNSRC